MREALGRLLVFTAALGLPAAAAAQNPPATPPAAPAPSAGTVMPMMWGPTAGANFSSFGGSDATGSSSRTAFYVGLAVQRGLAPNIFLNTGATYMMRGADATGGLTFKINYINIPIQIGYLFPTRSAISPYISGGLDVGINVSCDLEQGGTSDSCENQGADAESVDYGLALGGGILLGGGRFSIDARYFMGLKKITDQADIKNKGITLGGTYRLGGN